MRILVFALALFLQMDRSVWDGVYSDAQAARGKNGYTSACASCHGETLGGRGQTPPLVGSEFLKGWEGQSLNDLFEKIQATMPADAPGRLGRDENADILAYILSSNKYPAGRDELSPEGTALQRIRIESAPSKK